jgi:hypothetical protein
MPPALRHAKSGHRARLGRSPISPPLDPGCGCRCRLQSPAPIVMPGLVPVIHVLRGQGKRKTGVELRLLRGACHRTGRLRAGPLARNDAFSRCHRIRALPRNSNSPNNLPQTRGRRSAERRTNHVRRTSERCRPEVHRRQVHAAGANPSAARRRALRKPARLPALHRGSGLATECLDPAHALLLDDLFDTGASMEAASAKLKTYSKINNVYAVALTWK